MSQYQKAIDLFNQGPKLNEEDYHASTGFLSNSFIKSFQKCEYSSIIEMGEKSESTFNQTFAIGHLVEAYIFEGEDGFQQMCERYKDNVYSKAKGKETQLLKWVTDCKVLANSVLKHDNLKSLLRSESSIYHQVLTFDLHGMMWRGEIDYLNLNKKIEVDLKTTASNFKDKSYNPETRQRDLTFIDEWDYHLQRALYQEGIRQTFDIEVTPYILATSKSTKSTRLFKFDDQDKLDSKIAGLAPIIERFQQVLSGSDPVKCEICPNCVKDEIIDFEILTSKYCAGE
jgi:hypothetical protein